MTEDEQSDDSPLDWEQIRQDADKGREPQLIKGQLGQRYVSWMALVERIEREFVEEHSPDALAEAETSAQRLKLLVPVVNYVLAVESVTLDPEDKAALIEHIYSNLFGYGPLDRLFLDETITTVVLEGADKVAVRYGHGDLEALGPLFDSEDQFRRVLRRLLLDAGADLFDNLPFIETGLRVESRPVGLSVITPMMSFNYSADIRLHPKTALTLDRLTSTGFLNETAAQLLSALARSDHGMVVVGDVESGKTTLLSVLANLLPEPSAVVSVERAGEMHLPDAAHRMSVGWPQGPEFGALIEAALMQNPACMLLDELRSDEPEAVAPLLTEAQVPRQIWSFRGPFDAKRLRSALSMLARRADQSQGEAMVHALYARLPFIVTVWRVHGELHLYSVAEWQHRESDYPDYVPLLRSIDGELRLTGQRPAHTLDLDDSFWDSDH